MNIAKWLQRQRGKLHRTYEHINHSERGDVFLPQWRMNRIRHEQSVMNSQLKRKGLVAVETRRMDCHCGSVDCMGNIYASKTQKAK